MRKRITVDLYNSFHVTFLTLSADEYGCLSAGQVRKARKILCGIEGCTCGGSAGQRPVGQYGYEEQPDGGAYLAMLRRPSL